MTVREARIWVESVCRQWVVAPRCERLALVTSELVTNALVHGTGRIELDLTCSDRCVHLEVSDSGDAVVHPIDAGADALHGRGLQIVAALSDRWGTFRSPARGTTVWAQVLI